MQTVPQYLVGLDLFEHVSQAIKGEDRYVFIANSKTSHAMLACWSLSRSIDEMKDAKCGILEILDESTACIHYFSVLTVVKKSIPEKVVDDLARSLGKKCREHEQDLIALDGIGTEESRQVIAGLLYVLKNNKCRVVDNSKLPIPSEN